MTATSQSIGIPQNKLIGFRPRELRTVARHLVGWMVAWWFFAKVLPVFENVHLALGFAVSSLGSFLVGVSHFSTSWGTWLIPVCVVVDCALAFVAERKGGRPWQGRCTLAVEVFLFTAVALAMLVFLPRLVMIWVGVAS